MEWLRRSWDPDDEVTELPVPKAPSPVIVNLTSDDEDGDNGAPMSPITTASDASIPFSDETVLPSPTSPYEVTINVDFHVKKEDLFDEETNVDIISPDHCIEEEYSMAIEGSSGLKVEGPLEKVDLSVDSPSSGSLSESAPLRADSPPVKVEISEDDQRAALFGQPSASSDTEDVATAWDSPSPSPSPMPSPSHSPSPSPSPSANPSPSVQSPVAAAVLHPLQLPSAQPMVLLRRLESDPILMAKYKLKRKLRRLLAKEERKRARRRSHKHSVRRVKKQHHSDEEHLESKAVDKQKPVVAIQVVKKQDISCKERSESKAVEKKKKDSVVRVVKKQCHSDEDESKCAEKQKTVKRKLNPLTILLKEDTHKHRRISSRSTSRSLSRSPTWSSSHSSHRSSNRSASRSPLRTRSPQLTRTRSPPQEPPKRVTCQSDVIQKRKLDLALALKNSVKVKTIVKTPSKGPIPKLEDGPKPLRILESRRTSSECPVTQSPCAMLYSAEPRKSYCTKADGSEATVSAPGCRAPASPSWLEDLLFSICRWDPRWLQESRRTSRTKAPNILPAKEMDQFFKSGKVFTYRFESVGDYQRHFRRALLLQLWDDVSMTFLKKTGSNEKMLVSVDRVKNKPLKDGRVHRTFHCHCGIADGKRKTQPIRGGDLVLMKITASEVKEVFAYAEVSAGSKELLSNTVCLSPLIDAPPEATHKFSFRLTICVEEHSLLLQWEPGDIISCRVTKIGNFYDEVEVFKILQDSTKFPDLMDLIINPTPEEECSEYMGLKSCSDMSAAQKKIIISVIKSIQRCGPSVSVVEGPPGTGKTRMLCALAQELAEKTRRDERDCRIIIAGKTNRTLASIMKYLLNRRMKESEDPNVFRVVRLGSSRHPNDDARASSVTVDALAERLSRASGIDADKLELRRLEQERRHTDRDCGKARRRGEEVPAELKKKLASCTRQILLLEKKIRDLKAKESNDDQEKDADKGLILKNADIIVTAASCSQERNLVEKKLMPRKHHVLIIDDAAEITEPVIIKLIVIFNVTDLVLIGDKQNHEPFAPSYWARKAGLSVPLIQRYTFALHKENASWHILDEQQRMHPVMLKGLESLFDTANIMKPALKFPRQAVCPFAVFNCTYIEKEEEEVDFVEKLLIALQSSRINLKDVGFTSFSRVALAEARHRANMCDTSCQSLWISDNICKPDALSGLQYKVMIVSCGLSPKSLRNSKSTTIALTRAQRALFICGNFRFMEEIPDLWSNLIKNSKELSKFEDVTEKDLSSEALLTSIQFKSE